LRARPGVLVIDIFVGLALVVLVLAAAGIILPLWGAAIGVVGLLTVVVVVLSGSCGVSGRCTTRASRPAAACASPPAPTAAAAPADVRGAGA
jgi:hypothetical protein